MLPSADWIGEVGLDFAPGMGRTERSRQISLFQAVLDHDLTHGRPMTVHSRGAAKDTVARLGQSGRRAVLHWYSGPLAIAEEAVAAGLWFSVNPTMARSKKGLALLPRLPQGRVLYETDGPYCKVGNRPAVPADVDIVVRALSRSWGATQEEVRAQLALNASALVGASA